MFAMAILAGAFIAMGANYATTVWAGLGKVVVSAGKDVAFTTAFPYGIQRLLGGLVFATGLMMVVIGGSELFTGNCLIPHGPGHPRRSAPGPCSATGSSSTSGTSSGPIVTAYMVFLGGQHTFEEARSGVTALNIGIAKSSLGFLQCTVLAIFCNALVCMAVWMCFSARGTGDKVLAILPPISAFVACGFEHCVANMYFIPSALFIKGLDPTYFATVAGGPQGRRCGSHLGQLLRRQPDPRDHRQHHRRGRHGRRHVLVHFLQAG